MNLEGIDKRPIIILSTPRSGSTILAYNIQQFYKNKGHDLRLYNEVIDPDLNNRDKTDFTNIDITSNEFILKVHLWDLLKYFPTNIKNLINTGYLIRIRRKDFAKQLLSYYIEHKRQIWGYTKQDLDKIDISDMHIEHNEIIQLIPLLHLYNKVLDKVDYKYDMDVYYEDLVFDDSDVSISTPKPKNYTDLYNLCKNYVKNPHIYTLNWYERKYVYKLLPDLKIG